METRNAVITDSWIELDEFGDISAGILLDYGDGCQAFGSNGLYTSQKGLLGKNYAGFFIFRVLKAVGVHKWEEIKGRAVRVVCDSTHVESIGHIVKGEWFYLGNDPEQPDQGTG
jgi:hypothetical protein